MQHHASTSSAAVPYPNPARLGVKLLVGEDEVCRAHPEPTPGEQAMLPPLALPRLRTDLLHPCAAMAQTLWRDHQRQMISLFYLDVVQATWKAIVPNQHCGYDAVHCRLGAPDNPWGVTANERLAGSLRSLHVNNPAHLPAEVPTFDGVHLFLDLGFDGLCFWSYCRTGEQVTALAHEEVALDEGRAWLHIARNQLHLLSDGPEHDAGESREA